MIEPGAEARQKLFPALGDLVYLDTATKGVPPSCTAEQLAQATTQWAAGLADHGVWESAAEEARVTFASLVGMTQQDVALLPSHVTAASLVARALPNARVVIPDGEYRGNLLPWMAGREAVQVVPSPAGTDRLCEAVSNGTDIVAVSNIQSADGFRIDLPRLVEHAHSHQALVYVDASQSVGVDADLVASGADFVGAVGYKWMLGGRGTAFLAMKPAQQERFAPVLLAPESSADIANGVVYGPDYRLWDDARRFDQPQAWFPWVATATSMQLLSTFDLRRLDVHASRLAQQFSEGVRRLGFAPAPTDVLSPIVTYPHPQAKKVVDQLWSSGIRASARADNIRFAFHIYNTDSDVERVLNALNRHGYR